MENAANVVKMTENSIRIGLSCCWQYVGSIYASTSQGFPLEVSPITMQFGFELQKRLVPCPV